MDRNFSSSTTFAYKFIFPAIWIALCGMFALQMSHLVPPHSVPNRMTALGAIALWIVGSAFFLRLSVPLLRVQLRDGHLYASNYIKETEILPLNIAKVTQNVWVNVRPITIHLQTPSEFGRRIRFIPPARVILRFWIEDPIVEELRTFARRPALEPLPLE